MFLYARVLYKKQLTFSSNLLFKESISERPSLLWVRWYKQGHTYGTQVPAENSPGSQMPPSPPTLKSQQTPTWYKNTQLLKQQKSFQ